MRISQDSDRRRSPPLASLCVQLRSLPTAPDDQRRTFRHVHPVPPGGWEARRSAASLYCWGAYVFGGNVTPPSSRSAAQNVTPASVYEGQRAASLDRRARLKWET